MTMENRLGRLERQVRGGQPDGNADPRIVFMIPDNGRDPEIAAALARSPDGYILDGNQCTYDADRWPGGPAIAGAVVQLPAKTEDGEETGD